MHAATEIVFMPPQRHRSRRSYPAHNTSYSGSPSSHDPLPLVRRGPPAPVYVAVPQAKASRCEAKLQIARDTISRVTDARARRDATWRG